MIDLKDLRERPEVYRQAAANKSYDPALVDELVSVDAELRAAQTEREQIAAEKNSIGKQIGQIAGRMKKAQGDEKAELRKQMAELQQRPNQLKSREQELDRIIGDLEPRRDTLWLRIPQVPDAHVPVGYSEADNVEIEHWSPKWFDPARSFVDNRGFAPRSHTELMQMHGMVDFERGVRMAGSRSYVLKGIGMRLHNAILRYAFDFMTVENGFTALSAPCLVRHEMMTGTGFFPDGRDQIYDIANPTGEYGLALSGTGEVGLMSFHADEILDVEQLPLRYTTLSTCFRREAGAAGKDTAGLYRIHQFDKVEQVVLCRADTEESTHWHRQMIGYVQTLLQRLEMPHRLLQCCTTDIGAGKADMVDIECWMPSRGEIGEDGQPRGEYGETHSASKLYDYQCRRLNIRYKDPETGRNVICHSLNNTVAASPRILIPMIEVYQNEDGSITIPEPLRPHMGGIEKIG